MTSSRPESQATEQASVNLLLDDSDDDSDKTDDPLFPWKKDSPGKIVQEAPIQEESPTTKTLKSFSQNMDDLYVGEGIGPSPSPKKVPKTSGCDLPLGYHREWDVHLIRIPPPAQNLQESNETSRRSLGIVIVRRSFPGTNSDSAQKPHCTVRGLREGGRAIRSGLQKGDWFLRPEKEESSSGSTTRKLATFDEIQTWSKESFPHCSPIRVLRRKGTVKKTNAPARNGNGHASLTTAKATSPSYPTATSTKAQTSNTRLSNKTQATIDSTRRNANKKKTNDGIPPFCSRCNYRNDSYWEAAKQYSRNKPRRIPNIHHTWCSKHHSFDAERVVKVLSRIEYGRNRLKCQACELEYNTGKIVPFLKSNRRPEDSRPHHTPECVRYQTDLRNKEKQRLEKEKEQKRTKAKSAQTKSSSTTPTIKNPQKAAVAYKTQQRKNDVCSSSDSDSNDDEKFEDGSIYQPPTRNRPRMETFTLSKDRPNPKTTKRKNTTDDPKTKDNSRNIMNEELRLFEKIPSRHRANTKNDTTQRINPHSKNQNPRDRHRRVKPKWVPLYDDPWGEEGYQIGDVLLFGPQKGVGHHETTRQCPSDRLRYKTNPFEHGSTYRTTHCTPEEGLSLLSLTRDALGTMPWGFVLVRDEFGHACIVESVDRNSPASAATYVGASSGNSNSGLNPNDMIVAMNGKPIGGMTKLGVELEIELSAPSLLLVVSRYKYAEEAKKNYAEMERQMLEVIDRAARDDRMMGWQEIGNGNCTTETAQQPRTSPTPALLPPGMSSVEASSASDNRWNSNKTVQDLLHTETMTNNNLMTESKGKSRLQGEIGTNEKTRMTEHQIAKETSKDKNSTECGDLASTDMDFHATMDCDSSSENSEDSAEHDENPRMGCVCGASHSQCSRSDTFWIQCESCHSWYHVASRCIGFDKYKAAKPNFVWKCEACVPESETEEEANATEEHHPTVSVQDTTPQRQEANGSYSTAAKVTTASSHNVSLSEMELGRKIESETKHALSSGPLTGMSHQDKQRKKKIRLERALRELESGGKYWETYSASTIYAGRCIRKRKVGNNEENRNCREGENLPAAESTKRSKKQLQTSSSSNDDVQSIQKRTSSRFTLGQHQDKGSSGTTSDTSAAASLEVDCDATITGDQNEFKRGDMVIVESHAWAYVNNQGGIGLVVKVGFDEGGDRIYDVKYPALQTTERGILAKFIKSYSFL